MLALYIILGILALIVLLLALPLRIFLRYEPEPGFQYRVKYLFLTLADSAKEAKPKKPKPSSGAQAPAKKKSGGKATEKLLDFLGLKDVSSAANFKRAVGSKGLAETVRGVFAAVRDLFSRIGGLIKKSVFKRFDLKITVGDSDAADAAIRYGEVCAAVYPLLTLLDGAMKFKKRTVDVRCDFEQEHTAASFDGQLNYRPIHIVGFLFGLIGRYIKQSVKKGGTANE